MPAEDAVVSGAVVFAEALQDGGAVMHVFVEDVTHADAAARVAARLDVLLPGAIARGQAVPFRLSVAQVDAGRHYSVRVHIDRSANGRIEAGDHISTQSYPVLTCGAPSTASVAVVLVAGS